MGVVFNDKFMSRARVVSRSDYAKCQKCSKIVCSAGNAFEIIRMYLQIQTDKNKKNFKTIIIIIMIDKLAIVIVDIMIRDITNISRTQVTYGMFYCAYRS